jgi:RNA polymerase sigma-70 factor (ECF subfamily)
VQQADPQRGRFRTFLLTACQHFLSNEWRDGRAQKRGGGRPVLRLEFDSFNPQGSSLADDALTPEQVFERDWATTLLGRVMLRLEQEQADFGKAAQFTCLKHFLASNRTAGGYDVAAAQLGMTEAAARMAASRLRGRYRELLRDEIAQTVASADDVEQEIADLFRAFAPR